MCRYVHKTISASFNLTVLWYLRGTVQICWRMKKYFIQELKLELIFNEKFNLVLPCYGAAFKRTCTSAENQWKFYISRSFEELGNCSAHELELCLVIDMSPLKNFFFILIHKAWMKMHFSTKMGERFFLMYIKKNPTT